MAAKRSTKTKRKLTTQARRRQAKTQKRAEGGRFAGAEPPLLTFPEGTFTKPPLTDGFILDDGTRVTPAPARTVWQRVRDFFLGRP